MNYKTNSLKFGLILGLLIPLVVIFLFYLYYIDRFGNLRGFYDFLVSNHIHSKLASLSVIPNLLLFFVFLRGDALSSARGVLTATFIYGALIVGLYYFV